MLNSMAVECGVYLGVSLRSISQWAIKNKREEKTVKTKEKGKKSKNNKQKQTKKQQKKTTAVCWPDSKTALIHWPFD